MKVKTKPSTDERWATELVRERIADYLATSVQHWALAQYVSVLVGRAEITGVTLDAATSLLLPSQPRGMAPICRRHVCRIFLRPGRSPGLVAQDIC